ncbi:MAG: Wzz/FepE/Etk N-terminal domain-containing protein [Bacteroidales bacterium]
MEEEINLIEVARTLWLSRRTILLIVLIFGALGLFIALVSPVEYTAKTIIVTRAESRGSAAGSLGGLAALVGINLGAVMDAGSELTPIDYPEFIQSLSFQKSLMYTPLTWQQFPKPVTLFDYYDKYYKPGFLTVVRQYTIGLPKVIIGWVKGKNNKAGPGKTGAPDDGLVYLSNSELGVRGILTKKLKLTLNPNNNFIKLEAKAPEAKAAAQIARKARELLQEKVTELKINKATQNLQFTQGLYAEKKSEFVVAQDRLAQFRDKNLNLDSEMAKTEEDRLISEYQIAFSVYNELAKQLENAKIRVKEDTPIFSVIEEATVPNFKSKPKTEMILLIWIFLGGVVGLVWVLAARILKEAKKKWDGVG